MLEHKNTFRPLPVFEKIGSTAKGEPVYAYVSLAEERRQKWWDENKQEGWKRNAKT